MPFFNFNLYPKVDEENASTLQIKGRNQKQLAIVYKKKDSYPSQIFLEKILNALSFDLHNDTCYIELANESSLSFKTLRKSLSFQYLIVFGLSPQELSLHIQAPLYKAIHWQHCILVFAEDLQSIAEDRNKKRILWDGLKATFSI